MSNKPWGSSSLEVRGTCLRTCPIVILSLCECFIFSPIASLECWKWNQCWLAFVVEGGCLKQECPLLKARTREEDSYINWKKGGSSGVSRIEDKDWGMFSSDGESCSLSDAAMRIFLCNSVHSVNNPSFYFQFFSQIHCFSFFIPNFRQHQPRALTQSWGLLPFPTPQSW